MDHLNIDLGDGADTAWTSQRDAEADDGRITLASLAGARCWVAWQVQDEKDRKATKVPFNPLSSPGARDDKARANAPTTWGTRAQAEARLAKLTLPYGIGGVGIEFTQLSTGVYTGGLDLDSCRDPATGALATWAEEVLVAFDTYAEVSPSQTGVKLFFTVASSDLPPLRKAMGVSKPATDGKPEEYKFSRTWKWTAEAGREHPPAIELHLGNRFFAVTGERLPEATEEFRLIPAASLLRLITTDGPAFAAADSARGSTDAGAAGTKARGPTDRSRSATAFRKGKQLVRDGATYEEMCAALREDPETAAWMREKGDANAGREARRIFEAAGASGPLIQLRGGQLHNEATAGEDALLAAGKPIYQRGNDLVRPAEQLVPASRGRTTRSACLIGVTAHGLVDHLCGAATWERYDARANEWLEVNPPMAVAQTILSRAGDWRFPRIAGVITTPTLRPDGSILAAAGYDAATRLYHLQDPDLQLHPAVNAPTRADAEKALKLLNALLDEFPFVDTVSRSVALSGLITPVVRGALSVVPLHAFKAFTAGTGKSYLADVASAISTGRPCPVASAAPDEAETEKRLVGLLLAGFPISSLDNVNGELGGDLLCQAIERPLVRVRPLGRSDIVEIESRSTIFATGNNLRVRGDMVRRTILCSLDAGVERPELREFKADPIATVMADRGRYVSACLIIVRAYAGADRPSLLKAIASFEDWSNAVRSALVWLSAEDPAASMEAAREDDPELADLREVIGLWHRAFGSTGYTVGEIRAQAELREESRMGEPTDYRHSDLRDVLLRMFGERGEIGTRKLGNWLRNHEGKVVSGVRLTRAPMVAHGGSVRWVVRPPKERAAM